MVGNFGRGESLFVPNQSNQNFWVALERVLNATNSPLPTDCPVAASISTRCVTVNFTLEISSFSSFSDLLMTSFLPQSFEKTNLILRTSPTLSKLVI